MPAIPVYSDLDYRSSNDPINTATPIAGGGGGGGSVSFDAIQPGAQILRVDNNNVNFLYTDPGDNDVILSTVHMDDLGGYNQPTGEYTVQRDSLLLIVTQIRLDWTPGFSREVCRTTIKVDPGGGYQNHKLYEYYGGSSHEQEAIPCYAVYEATAGDVIKFSFFSTAGSNIDLDGDVQSSYLHVFELASSTAEGSPRLLLDTNNQGVDILHPANGGATIDIVNDTASTDPEGGYDTGTGEYTFAEDALVLVIAQIRSSDLTITTYGKTEVFIDLDPGGGYGVIANYRNSWSDSISDECVRCAKVVSVSAGDKIKMSAFMNVAQVGWNLSGSGDGTYLQITELAKVPSSANFSRILLQAEGGVAHTSASGAEDIVWATPAIDPESAYNGGTGEYTFASDARVLVIASTKRAGPAHGAEEEFFFEVDTGGGYATASKGGTRFRGTGLSLIHNDTSLLHFDIIDVQAGWDIKVQLNWRNSILNVGAFNNSANNSYWQIIDLTGGSGLSQVRERLLANRTYYVDPTGSDSLDGLTPGTAFATVQKAIDIVAGLDTGISDVTIQLADGTYNILDPIVLKDPVGSGFVTIQGNTADKTLVVIDGNATANQLFSQNGTNKYNIEWLTGTDAVQSFVHLAGAGGGTIFRDIRVLDIGPRAFYAVGTGGTGFFRNDLEYDYTGGTVDNIFLALALEAVLDAQGLNLTITGNPNFTDALFSCDRNSSGNLTSATATGSFSGTGRRAAQSSVILSQGASGFGSVSTASNGFVHT